MPRGARVCTFALLAVCFTQTLPSISVVLYCTERVFLCRWMCCFGNNHQIEVLRAVVRTRRCIVLSVQRAIVLSYSLSVLSVILCDDASVCNNNE